MKPEDRSKKQMVRSEMSAIKGMLRQWDPIGVSSGTPAENDLCFSEYDNYAPQILSRLRAGCTQDDLVSYLAQVRTEFMGLSPNPVRDTETSVEIIRWWEKISSRKKSRGLTTG